MPYSPTAAFLSASIDGSKLTQREIAKQTGFKNPNILSMLKTGGTKVPLDRIPALARVLNLDAQEFLIMAIAEYHSGIHQVLVDVLGLPLSETEREILSQLRSAGAPDLRA